MPSSIHLWKSRFFFVKTEQEWGFDPGWGVPRMEENKIPRLSKEEARIRAALVQLEPARFEDLLSEDTLHNAGLSPRLPSEMMRSTADFAAKMRERGAAGERRKKRRLGSRAGGPPAVVSPERVQVVEFAPPVIAVSESIVEPLSAPSLRERPFPGDAAASPSPHAGPSAPAPEPPPSLRPHDIDQEPVQSGPLSPGLSRAVPSSFAPPQSLAQDFFGASRSSAEFAARSLPPLARKCIDSLTPTRLVDELYVANYQSVLYTDRLVKAYVQNASELVSLRLKEGQEQALKAAEERAEQIAQGLERVRQELERAREELEQTRREGNEKINSLLIDVKKWEERSEVADQQLCAAESEKGALRVELVGVRDQLQLERRRGDELTKQLQESAARESELASELNRAKREAASAGAQAAKMDADIFERNADAYEKGFRSCKWQVQQRLDKVDLNFLDLGVPAPSSSGTDSEGGDGALEVTSSMPVTAGAGEPGSFIAGKRPAGS